MNKESLKIAREVIIQALDEAKIEQVDKAELMLNITNFLDENEYKENIKVLAKRKTIWRKTK